MPEQVWMCKKCGSLWKDEKAASECEAIHKTPASYRVIEWVPYDRNSGHNSGRIWPKTIVAKIDIAGAHEGYDSATYELTRIGPRGL